MMQDHLMCDVKESRSGRFALSMLHSASACKWGRLRRRLRPLAAYSVSLTLHGCAPAAVLY